MHFTGTKTESQSFTRRTIAPATAARAFCPKDREYLRSLRQAEMSLWMAIQRNGTSTGASCLQSEVRPGWQMTVTHSPKDHGLRFSRNVSRIFREMRSIAVAKVAAMKGLFPAFSTVGEKRDAVLFTMLAAATLLTFIGFVATILL